MSHLISVQLDVLGGLLAELRALGVELGEDQVLSAATGPPLERALPGPVGEEAALAATAVIVTAVVISKRRSTVVGGESDTPAEALTKSAT